MENKIFGNKKMTIRKLSKSDLKRARDFLAFINSLVEEEAKILMNKKLTLKEEGEFLEGVLKGMKTKTKIYLAAECGDKIVGSTSIELGRWGNNHTGNFGIVIRQGYRGIGLGKYLMTEILKMAKKELKPAPKIIKLTVYPNNKPALGLYKKMGFKIVARIPKQRQYKGKLLDEIVMLKFL